MSTYKKPIVIILLIGLLFLPMAVKAAVRRILIILNPQPGMMSQLKENTARPLILFL